MNNEGHDLHERMVRVEYLLETGFKDIRTELARLTEKVGEQNGRVGKLENRWRERDLHQARMDGLEEGKASLRRRDFAIIGTLVSIAVAIGTVAIRAMEVWW